MVAAAAPLDIRIQLTLTGPAPAWATSNHRPGVVGPDVADYADFVSQAARHFRGEIERYAIWNEPNLAAWLQRRGGCQKFAPCLSRIPGLYRSLYLAGYGAIRAADPRHRS